MFSKVTKPQSLDEYLREFLAYLAVVLCLARKSHLVWESNSQNLGMDRVMCKAVSGRLSIIHKPYLSEQAPLGLVLWPLL